MESNIQEIIDEYKTKGGNIELEIRFKNITRDIFISIYKGSLKDKELKYEGIEETMKFSVYKLPGKFHKKHTAYIRELIFNGHKKINEKYYKKVGLFKPTIFHDYLTYSINVNKEENITNFSITEAEVRIKLRSMFIYKDKWRFDYSLIRKGTLKNLGEKLASLRDKIFKDRNKDNYLDVDEYLINDYSIEIEYIGKQNELELSDFKIVHKIYQMIDPNYLKIHMLKEELYKIADNIMDNKERLKNFKNLSLKTITNQVISLNKSIYKEIYPPINYYLTEKIDGERCVITIDKDKCRIVTHEIIEYINKDLNNNLSIIEGEYVENKGVYLFDIMIINGKNIINEPFYKRLEMINKGIEEIKKYIPKKINIGIKNFIKIEQERMKEIFTKVYKSKYDYNIDGLILTTIDKNYYDTTSYKWKPLEKTTIDFLVKKIPSKLIGMKPYINKSKHDLYILFNGINSSMFNDLGLKLMPYYEDIFEISGKYMPIQFSPSINPYAYIYYHKKEAPEIDGKIIELRKENVNEDWIFVKIREDRQASEYYFGNDYKIAEIIYQNYLIKFELEDLYDPSFGYFNSSNIIYKASNNFKRFVISNIFKKNIKGDWVIDLAAGRGADIHRYKELGIKNVLAVDKDVDALSELVKRKYEYSKKVKYRNPMSIHILVQDLKEPVNDIIENIKKYDIPMQVDNIVCNFSLHYFNDTIKNIKNIIELVSTLLKVNGIFIFTILNGEDIFEKLKDISYNDTWKIIENNIDKYVIKKKYEGKKLLNVGQFIEIKLPFSDEYYEEPLFNLNNFIKLCKQYKLSLELNDSFDKYLDLLDEVNPKLYDNISKGDIEIIKLTRIITMRKMK